MDITSCFEALSIGAVLDLIVPITSDLDVTALLQDGKAEPVAQALTRRNLFFDEEANVFLVLKTATSEPDVRSILPHLELLLGAHATDAIPQGGGNAASASGKHDINSKTVPGNSFTDIVSCDDKTSVIWRLVLHLSRPRARLQRPAIYFTANLSISSNNDERDLRDFKGGYLKSFESLPANVLEPLRFDPVLGGSDVFLPENRITKVAPTALNPRETVKPIRGASKRAFPAVPALFSRIKFSSLPDAIIASLRLETSHVIAGPITIDTVRLESSGARVERLTDVKLPLETRPGDETILLYRMNPTSQSEDSNRREASLSISTLAHATIEQGSQIALNLSWQTHVNLDQTIPRTLYKWSRSLGSTLGHHRGISLQSNPGPVSEIAQRHSEGDPRVIFTFTAESTTYRGSEFKIKVLCINRTGRQRRFALLIAQPRKPRTQSHATDTEINLVASIFNRPTIERTKPLDALELTPDVRIGPLPPYARFETHLRFQALQTGVLDLGILRILDLDSRQIVDVRELPDIISLDKLESGVRLKP